MVSRGAPRKKGGEVEAGGKGAGRVAKAFQDIGRDVSMLCHRVVTQSHFRQQALRDHQECSPETGLQNRRLGVATDPRGIGDPALRLAFMWWMTKKGLYDAERERTERKLRGKRKSTRFLIHPTFCDPVITFENNI